MCTRWVSARTLEQPDGDCFDDRFGFGFQVTFPNRKHAPPQVLKLCLPLHIARYCASEFLLPEMNPALRIGRIRTTFMAMPETAMNKDDCPVLRENDIRLAREIRRVKAKAETSAVQQASQMQLRPGILAPDTRHIPGSPLRSYPISHVSLFSIASSTSTTISAICLARYGGTALPTW